MRTLEVATEATMNSRTRWAWRFASLRVGDPQYPDHRAGESPLPAYPVASSSQSNMTPLGRARLSTWQWASPPSSAVKMTSLLRGLGSFLMSRALSGA